MKKKHLLIALALYFVSAVVSYGTFSYFDKNTVVLPGSSGTEEEGDSLLNALLEIDPNEAKDQACPLNGQYYTQTERDAWEQRRPLFVMIENSPDARPQSGLSRADIVYEAVAEGGVTRFGAMYLCAAQIQDLTLAPIRSARTYFLDWASGYNYPMYVHVGGANVPGPTNALGQINSYGWSLENDLNQFSIGYPTFVRDYNRIPDKEVATEHTMVTTTEKLWAESLDREWTNKNPDRTLRGKLIEGTDWQEDFIPWTFEEEVPAVGDVRSMKYDFWSGYSAYDVEWNYDENLDAYTRSMGGEKHMDLNNGEQVTARNVVVMFTTEKGPINEKKHMIYGTTGTGKVLIFKHGEAIEATWTKKKRTSELMFVDKKGNDIEMARGLTWISTVGKTNEVEY